MPSNLIAEEPLVTVLLGSHLLQRFDARETERIREIARRLILADVHRLEPTRRVHGSEEPADEAERAEEPSGQEHEDLPRSPWPRAEVGEHACYEIAVMPFGALDPLHLAPCLRPAPEGLPVPAVGIRGRELPGVSILQHTHERGATVIDQR